MLTYRFLIKITRRIIDMILLLLIEEQPKRLPFVLKVRVCYLIHENDILQLVPLCKTELKMDIILFKYI